MTLDGCVVLESVAYNGTFIGNFSSTSAADCAAKCQSYSSRGLPPSGWVMRLSCDVDKAQCYRQLGWKHHCNLAEDLQEKQPSLQVLS